MLSLHISLGFCGYLDKLTRWEPVYEYIVHKITH